MIHICIERMVSILVCICSTIIVAASKECGWVTKVVFKHSTYTNYFNEEVMVTMKIAKK